MKISPKNCFYETMISQQIRSNIIYELLEDFGYRCLLFIEKSLAKAQWSIFFVNNGFVFRKKCISEVQLRIFGKISYKSQTTF